MRNGISAAPLPDGLQYGDEISAACLNADFFPALAYAVKWNETAALPDAATIISADGGHGLMQLTAAFPEDWADPYANALYAIETFLRPAETYWAFIEQGEALVRCILAEYNAGRANAIRGHQQGNVDLCTTDNYAARGLATYHRLLNGEPPE